MGFEPSKFVAPPRPAFGAARQHVAGTAPAARLTTAADRRYARAARTAAELLPALPAKGETVHALMLGTFDLGQVIAAVARLTPKLKHLRIATLAYSARNVKELVALLEARPGLRLTLLVSVFFRDHNKDAFAESSAELTAYPGAAVSADRNHAKVVCFDLGRGDGLVFEGSANLRGNGNREQLAATRCRKLHDWHARWIDEAVIHAQHEEAEAD